MTLLETRDLTIRFGGHVAVNSVSCSFRPGDADRHRRPQRRRQDHLLQFDLRAAAPPPAAASLFDGADITQLSAPLRTRAGLGRAFQLTNLFPNLTVEENVRLAVQSAKAGVHYDMLRALDRRGAT